MAAVGTAVRVIARACFLANRLGRVAQVRARSQRANLGLIEVPAFGPADFPNENPQPTSQRTLP